MQHVVVKPVTFGTSRMFQQGHAASADRAAPTPTAPSEARAEAPDVAGLLVAAVASRGLVSFRTPGASDFPAHLGSTLKPMIPASKERSILPPTLSSSRQH